MLASGEYILEAGKLEPGQRSSEEGGEVSSGSPKGHVRSLLLKAWGGKADAQTLTPVDARGRAIFPFSAGLRPTPCQKVSSRAAKGTKKRNPNEERVCNAFPVRQG